MNKRYLSVVSAVLLTFASGCASSAGGGGGGSQMQNTVYATHRLVQNLDRNLGSSVNQLNETTADLVAQVSASDAENRRLRSLVEENQIRLEALQRALDEMASVLYRELGVSPPSPVGRTVGRSVPSVPDNSFDVQSGPVEVVRPAPRQEAPDSTESTPIAPVVETPPEESNTAAAAAHYARAQQLYMNEEFALAFEEYGSYLRLYPESGKAGNAQYWKAHCHLKMSEFEEAIAEFQILVRDFPTNTKVPSALNNQGYSYSRLGQNANAIALFQQVISEYPNDAAVVIARQNLQQLEGKN